MKNKNKLKLIQINLIILIQQLNFKFNKAVNKVFNIQTINNSNTIFNNNNYK